MPSLIRMFGNSVRGMDSSRMLALGVALGAIIGFLPKDNLIVVALVAFMILSGANLITGTLSAIVSTIVGSFLQPTFHAIGAIVLGWEPVVVPLSKFLQLPWAAWTRLDNTVVTGAVLFGLAAAIPLYLISFYLFAKYREPIERVFTQGRIATWIIGYPAASASTEN